MTQAPNALEDDVLRCLHEVAAAAREVPAETQPKRLQDALASLVSLDVVSAGTFIPPEPESYAPGA